MFWLLALLSSALVLTNCKPTEPVPDTIVQREDTLTIAQLRAFVDTSVPSRIRIKDSGREGVFTLDQADVTTEDNTGVTLVTRKGYRYKRDYTGPASFAWFGATPSTDDIGPVLQVAVNATNDLLIPDGQYTQLTEVKLRSNLTLRGNAGKVVINLPKSYVSLVNPENPSIDLRNIVIDGLTWRVTSQEKGRYGPIYIDGPSVADLTVQNCASSDAAAKDSTNWLTVKIQAGKTGDRIVVRNNTVQAKRMGCEIFNHDNHGIYAGRNISVTGNSFSNCRFGLSLSGPLEQLLIDNNYVKDCSLFGIEVAGAARSVTITNNRFEGTFDKFLEGSNDGNGNGSVINGMVITGNSTVGVCTGGIQLFNAGATTFNKNVFRMTGMLELGHSSAGGTFTENIIESAANKAVICDNSPNNTFSNNTISNKGSTVNHATFMAYGSKATNNVLTNNKLIQGDGGKPYDAVLGGSLRASMNYDEASNPIP